MADPALTGWWDFANQKTLASRQNRGSTFNIVRASTAPFVDSAGIIQTAAGGVERFDHDPATLKSLGVLIEEARTNICLHSEGFSAPWTSIGTPILNATSVTAPDGSNRGMSINDNSGAAFEGVQQLIPISSAIKTYTYSLYVLKGDINDPTMGVNLRTTGGAIPPNNPNLRLNTLTGEIQDANSGIIGVEDKGGWWRINAQITTNTDNTNILIQIFAATSGNGFFVDTVAAAGVTRVWGHQVEEGGHASSYFRTTTAAVTRDADIIDTIDVSWLNAVAGTMFAEYTHLGVRANANHVWTLHNNSTSLRINHHLNGLGIGRTRSNYFAANGGTIASLLDDNDLPANIISRSALAWAVNDWRAQTDGRTAVVDGSGTPPVIAELAVGYQGVTNIQFLNGHLRELRYYNIRKPNQFLEDLSNGLIDEGGDLQRSLTTATALRHTPRRE